MESWPVNTIIDLQRELSVFFFSFSLVLVNVGDSRAVYPSHYDL